MKNPRAEMRINCEVRLQIKFDRGAKKYKVIDVVSEDNHPLQKPQACYLIPSHEVPEVACIDIHLTDSSEIWPKEAHELLSRQVGGLCRLVYTITDRHNLLRDMLKKAMEYRAVITVMNYFERRALENPSFQHFEEINEEHEIVNIVWADAKMITDYARFGDIVIFDTTFGTNKEKWVFDVFVGFNHYRETMIFGAALMFNQTIKSFEWVFINFREVHHGKKTHNYIYISRYCNRGCFREGNARNKVRIMYMAYKSKLCKIFDVL
jgi:MULE transposase domain